MARFHKVMVAACLFFAFTAPALADFRVGLEVPLFYTFKGADDGSSLDSEGLPSGYILLAQLPFFPGGVGFESYEIKLDKSGDHSIALLMADVFYLLPVPVVDVSLGAGYGTVAVNGDCAANYETSASYQYFLRIGVPVGAAFTVIGSFHNVFAHVKTKNTDSVLEAGGTLTTIGVAMGF